MTLSLEANLCGIEPFYSSHCCCHCGWWWYKGCKGAQVEEIWSMEPENFQNLKPVHGLIFLFKWQPGEEPAGSIVQDSRLDQIFFAKQVINNACATQAIVSVLLNCSHPDMELGETLTEFREFSQSFDAA
ncbi:ubiquitin carboxyl-terminal hydrolase isozyme L5 isoform X1, partial [Tachysurus ichikawai]